MLINNQRILYVWVGPWPTSTSFSTSADIWVFYLSAAEISPVANKLIYMHSDSLRNY